MSSLESRLVASAGLALPAPAIEVGRCPFCPETASGRYERVHGTVAAFQDAYPVSDGHYLVVPLRHTETFFTMTDEERFDCDQLIATLAEELSAVDGRIEGFNIGMNCGVAAGQTIGHAHTHLIPRRTGDTPAPRGGVRGVIPARMNY